jgi:hypothetical protein
MCGLIPPPPYRDTDTCDRCGAPASLHDDGECVRWPACRRCGDTGTTTIGDDETWCECETGKRLDSLPW